MTPKSLLLLDPPDLSDEAAGQMLDFLYDFTAAFESQYLAQIIRHDQMGSDEEPPQSELFEMPDYESLPF